MKKVALFVILNSIAALAQVSGVGQLGCNGAPVTGTAWTTATSLNTAQTLVGPNSPLPGALVMIDQTTTLTVGAVTFQEDYGDGNLINVEAWRIYTPATPALIGNPYTLVASTNQPFFINLAGIHKLNLKLTTAITGSGTVTPFTTAWCGVAPLTPIAIKGNAGANVDAPTGASPPANALLDAGLGSGATGGFLVGKPVGDTYKAINISTATTTLIVTGVSGRQVRIAAQHMLTALANNVAWIEGTGATCGTGTAGMAGGTTAASGYNFGANGGLAQGSGVGTVLQTVTTGDSVCLVTSAATQLSGGIEYAIY